MNARTQLVESLLTVGKSVLPLIPGTAAGITAGKAVIDLYDKARDLFDHEPQELTETREAIEARIAAGVDATVDKLRGA